MRAAELAESIRSRVLESDLPRDLRTPVITRPSDGRGVCGCCSEPIAPAETQQDVERRVDGGDTEIVAMHVNCYRIWRQVVETLYLLDGAAGVSRVPTGSPY
jgi:hypothetical protein